MQSKTMSLIETIASTFIGLAVAILTQIIVFPLYGMEVKLLANIQIACIFTIVSILRGYCLRRMFNSISGKT